MIDTIDKILSLIYVVLSIIPIALVLYYLREWEETFGPAWSRQWVVRLFWLLCYIANFMFALYLAVQYHA